jgi:hypothetical protein
MKGRRSKPYSSKTLLNCWRQMLERINEIKARGGHGLDPHALAEVTDYILDNIDLYRPSEPVRVNEKVSLKKNSLRLPDNPANNQSGRESENA